MIFILIGIAFILVTIYILWKRRTDELKLEEMLESNRSSTRDLQKSIAGNSEKLDYVEVKGTSISDNKLISPFSFTPSVYYKSMIIQVYKKKETFVNQNGQKQDRWKSFEDIVFDEENYTDFFIEDEDGKVKIDLKGAEITPEITYESNEKVQVFKVSERFNEHAELKQKFENVVSDIKSNIHDKEVTGYQFKEFSLPLNKTLFVQGKLTEEKENPKIVRGESKPLIVSVKSANQIYQNMEEKIQKQFFLAIVCGLGGLVFIFYGIKTLL